MKIPQKARRLLCVVLAALQVFLSSPVYAWEKEPEEAAESSEEQQPSESKQPQEEDSPAATTARATTEELAEPDEAVVGTSVLRETEVAPEASVFTGAATYRIPIQVPPGRSLTPEIALT